MSTATLPRSAGDFGDWDELAQLAIAEDAYARDEYRGPRHIHQPTRREADQAAIRQSEEDFS